MSNQALVEFFTEIEAFSALESSELEQLSEVEARERRARNRSEPDNLVRFSGERNLEVLRDHR